MAQAGATALIGHGPHVVRAAECINGVPVFHSVGNFVSIGGLSVNGLPSVSVAAEFLFDEKGQLKGSRAWPVNLASTKLPLLDPSGRAVHLINLLSQDAAQNYSGFKPLPLQGFENGLPEFREWIKTTPLSGLNLP